ncbi:hypothetical protein DM826_07500 [Halonotius aquaticus]|uniref:Uncharacterized protein n=1 Tax=Halonotius aquaticus TaxID=2216978 RepID=A0A3A6PM02_9EURY|nr:hypothetical protein [Halonotius aquaticus]RJX43142.1 hypothetical protein DM826_07500 [Halonotius aquaticus]
MGSRFDDLKDEAGEEDEESDAGSEALDGLADTVSSDPTDTNPDTTVEQQPTTEEEEQKEEDSYDPESDPAFPAVRSQTQHTIYCLPETWERIDGSAGLLFETEVRARRDGMGEVPKRELHNAVLRAAADKLTVDDIHAALVETRQERADGDLIDLEADDD